MPENAAVKFIAALKKRLNVDSDEILASALGVGKSTLATWRKRGDVPKKARGPIQVNFGIDYDLIANNPEGIDKQIQSQISAAVYLAIIQLGAHISADRHIEFAAWLAQYDYKVRYLILEHFRRDDIVRAKPSDFTEMLMRVARGELGAPEKIVALKEAVEEGRETAAAWFPT